jgi:uroporphyrinogen-III synthase
VTYLILAVYYDILAFLVYRNKSFYKNFPDFEQNDTRIAVLEVLHKKEARHGLRVDILAPTQHTFNDNGLRKYISEANKGK